MKYLIYSDNHFCQYSSIIRGRGDYFSLRLENQLKTLEWIRSVAEDNKVDAIFNLGDFFDKPDLNSEELTALSFIRWSTDIPQYFIVGNHEMGLTNNLYSSSAVLDLPKGSTVFEKPQWFNDDIFILPYILESNRKPLIEYLGDKKPKIILSHNDIKGVKLGQFISQNGFDIDEIGENCRIFINGHIHNGGNIAKNIVNIGNITGQNFNEDASLYNHKAIILDTDKNTIDEIENPYAFNFYKIDFTSGVDTSLKLKSNAVVSVKIRPQDRENVILWLDKEGVISRRIIVDSMGEISEDYSEDVLSVDHIQKFKEFILDKLGKSELVISEVEEVVE